ncbi:MAG: ATPase [Fibrobacteraceae bacterium]|jgi:V/A-type H+-transporting ATPase subunit E|nr:ATPase [Fibrobacteraceae bacterium]
MAEDLQYLIDRIQKEAVEKAEAESAAIIAAAKAKAEEIIKNANAEAALALEKADKDAAVYAERSTRSLEQAARDVLISVGKSFDKMISDILALQVEKALSEDTLKSMLLSLVKDYSSDISVVFSENDKVKLQSFVLGEFQKALGQGVSVDSDKAIKYGFRVKLDGGNISHEFTAPAIAQAMSALVRPQIAEIVSNAAQGK